MSHLVSRLIDAIWSAPILQQRVCLCNSFYKRKARLVLLLNHFIPRCPYYNTYFAFRRTGVHPPRFLFS
ncbi:hypothetical protein MNB_SV-4-1171 [hydrothermal vent metagenome]|uniref:Uncharacterized protein n=1 Tax=hydrothermal vent metagenome TaxID=652676 RepID=A0A1W1E806_9ZZZZ